MTKFILGFAVGGLVFAFIQYHFALLPTSNGAGPSQGQTSVPDSLVGMDSAQDTRIVSDEGSQSSDIAAPLTDDTDSGESVEPEAESSVERRSGPANPIELPDTHAGFVDKSTPSLPDEHAKVEAEEIDSGWAEYVEAQIYSFINSHPSGEQIQIISLACRTTRCEIAGSVFGEEGGDVWNTVLADMRNQPWFSSNFSDSMFGSGGGYPGEFRFITILARVGSDITAPVPQ